jgi:tetratricopeptide (TPR) repeat protein
MRDMPPLIRPNRKKRDILLHLRKLNLAYQKIKFHFREASTLQGKKGSTRDDRDKMWQKAKEAYENYLDPKKGIHPEDVDALLEIGEIMIHVGKYDDAVNYFRKAKHLERNNPFYDTRIAEARIKSATKAKLESKRAKDLEDALSVYEELSSGDPDNLTFLTNYGILCVKLEKKVKLNNVIETMQDNFSSAPILEELMKSRNSLNKQEEPSGKHPLIITKGTAHNLQRQAQKNGVLMLLHIFNGASQSQIKDEWLYNVSTTKTLLQQLVTEDFIEEKEMRLSKSFVYFLTKAGRDESVLIEERLKKAVTDDKIFDEKYDDDTGYGITVKLVKKYIDWKQLT